MCARISLACLKCVISNACKTCSFNEVRLGHSCGDQSSVALGRGSLPPIVYVLVYMYISNGQSISYRHVHGYVTFFMGGVSSY